MNKVDYAKPLFLLKLCIKSLYQNLTHKIFLCCHQIHFKPITQYVLKVLANSFSSFVLFWLEIIDLSNRWKNCLLFSELLCKLRGFYPYRQKWDLVNIILYREYYINSKVLLCIVSKTPSNFLFIIIYGDYFLNWLNSQIDIKSKQWSVLKLFKS